MHDIGEPIKFKNRNDKWLFGIYHTPHKPDQADRVIVLLSPGIKSRVGPHRLYIKMTDMFLNMGYPVLRVDPEGLGDSEGEIHEPYTADVYGAIELGRLVNDTVDTLNWFENQYGMRKFILAGLCGGAITALLTGANDSRVEGILSLGMTCIISGSNADPYQYLTEGQSQELRASYFSKLLDPKSWLRLLTFRSDFKLMFTTILRPLIQRSRNDNKAAATRSDQSPDTAPPDTNLNPHFPKAFMAFVRQRKILLIFSEADRLFWEFEEKFLSIYAPQLAPYKENYQILTISKANHIFSFPEWQSEMLEASNKWLRLNFAPRGQ